MLWRISRRFLGLFYFNYGTVVGVISAMVEKELGERNFGFDSLKYMKCDMLPAAGCRQSPPPRSAAAGSARFSLLQIDVEVEEPETSENPTQSFEIHNIIRRHTQLLAVIIYILYDIDIYV